MAKVFICHRKTDADKAERLAFAIQAAGNDVWFDEWKIETGTSIVEQINRGLEQARYVVVCYSADGVSAPWPDREWMSALARQLAGHDVKILPARLTGALPPPAILADICYADLVADWNRGVAALLRTIR